ncbi:AbrB family transcriptional regulator [Citreicella sp. C3M06]|uniref:AbrB family transcriptional regulator n=1 Tax=Citreicella sp. C3M06 TaxID=2841564 RepID=UPI0020903C19|nr:AbrB family transcriptional regulator [Citreicella sp. C3M06]
MIVITAALLALGGVCGLAATALHLPMPFMLGSLGGAGAAVALGATSVLRDYRFPERFRTLFIGLIGVMIGTQVQPELLNDIGDFTLTLSALAGFVLLAHAGNYLIFHKLGGYRRATAFYAGMPGGLMESLVMGERAGADLPVLTAQQFLRIILVITLLPTGLSLWVGHPVGSAAGAAIVSEPVALMTLPLIVLAALAGLWLGQKLRLPAAQITGPLILAAGLTLSGGVDLHLPFWLIATAQVVIGVSLGLRFTGMTLAMLRRSLGLSLVSVSWMLMLGAAFALVLGQVTGLPFLQLLLAYAPGGVTEMSVIALSLAANPALVSLHHVVRILLTVGFMGLADGRLNLRER